MQLVGKEPDAPAQEGAESIGFAKASRAKPSLAGARQGEPTLAAPSESDRHGLALPGAERDAKSGARGEVLAEPRSPAAADAAARAELSGLTLGVVIGWGAAAFVLAVTYVARRLIMVGRLTTRQAVTEGQMPVMLDSLRAAFGLRMRVHLTSASTISSPVALGLNEICVPDAALTDLDAEQQRGLLAHELAHLARRDPLWLDAASLIERVFFFQPLNRLARRELQHNAEYICDDWAATRTGSGEPLARCLARVAEWIEASPLGVPVAGMAEQRSMLVSRIARLLEEKTMLPALSRVTKAVASLLVLGTVIAAAPSVHGTLPAEVVQEPVPAARGDSGRESDAAKDTVEQDPVIVAALIERLGDTNASVRRAAASSLGNLKARKAVPTLITTLADKNREVRAAAADALGNIEDDRAIAPLLKVIGDESPEVRERALDALGRFEHDVPAAPIIAVLSDPRPNIRQRAADILGNIGDRSAVAPLVKLLKDPQADVRREALHALERIKDPSVASAVLPMLGDENADVRGTALGTLRELRVPIAEATLMKALEDASHDVRQRAVEVVKDQAPSAALVAVLKKMMLEDTNSDVRESAVEALSEARSPAAREALRLALNSPDAKVRRAAAEALGNRP